MSPTDVVPLAQAVAIAGGDEHRTSPNPTVGCVLVAPDGTVVATGATEPPGGRHAELVALADAGRLARGTTAYVTLEPCDHTGRTGPCSRAVLAAGVERVVVAVRDPVPGHGGGLSRLADGGVDIDVLADGGWSVAASRRFHTRAATGRPWVTCKLAATPQGAMVAPTGRWITGPTARAAVHAQRARHDVVLVGVGTVLADDPRLDVRDAPTPRRQPAPVVLDTTARTPPTANVVRRGALVLHGPPAPAARTGALAAAGATPVEVAIGADGRVDPAAALAILAERGVASVYAEPGRTLATALIEAGVVDELVVHGPQVTERAAWPVPVSGAHHVRARRLGDDREDVLRWAHDGR